MIYPATNNESIEKYRQKTRKKYPAHFNEQGRLFLITAH